MASGLLPTGDQTGMIVSLLDCLYQFISYKYREFYVSVVRFLISSLTLKRKCSIEKISDDRCEIL